MTDYFKTVKGVDEIIADLRRLASEYPNAVAKALWDEAWIIMNLSKEQCPVKTGILRASGHVDDPVVSDGNLSVTFGYTMSYAIFVHENLEAYHYPPTKAKFLEDPMTFRLSYGFFWQSVNDRVLELLGVK